MKTTANYMDELRAKLGVDSDFKALHALGVNHRQQISKWRQLHGTFSEELSLKVAIALEIDPAEVILSMQIQRETNADVKKIWERLAKIALASAAALAITSTSASAGTLTAIGGGSCILCQINPPQIPPPVFPAILSGAVNLETTWK